MKYHAIGEQAPDGPGTDNVGITMLNATRDDANPSRLLVFVTVENYRRATAEVNIELEVYLDGNLQDVADVKGREVSKDDEKALRIAPRQLQDRLIPAILTEPKRDRPGQESAVFIVPDVADKANVVLRAVLRGAQGPLSTRRRRLACCWRHPQGTHSRRRIGESPAATLLRSLGDAKNGDDDPTWTPTP